MLGRRAALVLLTALLAACDAGGDKEEIGAGRFTVEASDAGFSVRDGARTLLRTRGAPATALRFDGEARMTFGRFEFSQALTGETKLTKVEKRGGALVVGGKLRLTPHAEGDLLRVDVEPLGEAPDGWRLQFDCGVHGDFLGFGEQYSFFSMKGRRVPIWSEENGLGRAEKPIPPLGTLFSSYYPMPYFLDPRGMGFVADSSAYQVFSMCEDGAATWSVEIWDRRPFAFYVLAGPTPMDVVTQLTTITGRTAGLPDWGYGLWLSAQGGTARVQSIAAAADAAGIDYTAVWAQDWVGIREFSPGNYGVKYRWALDPDAYPGFVTFVADLHARGKKFLGYFNPFILPAYDFFAPMAEKGYLIKNAAGDPYVFNISLFEGSLVDLTNPDAVAYFKGYAKQAVALGVDGWMSDFGEWLPWDARLFAGEAPYEHNLYPTRWHQASRDVLEAELPGDYVLLTRSGHLREAGAAQVVWAGDQEATWDVHDGFPTAVRANLTLALAGIPFVTSDIAGFSGGPSTKELWQRWVEFGAFSPVMRLHDGLKKLENWNFDRDAESAAFLARFTKIRAKLVPYLKALGEEALATGRPIVRPYVLVEADPAYWTVDDAYFLGNDVVVAPIVTEGAARRKVLVPPGTWRAAFGQGTFTGPQEATIAAPIGAPIVLARDGSKVAAQLGTDN